MCGNCWNCTGRCGRHAWMIALLALLLPVTTNAAAPTTRPTRPTARMARVTTEIPPAATQPAGLPGEDWFSPGSVWLDDHGVAINAHGGGLLFDGGVYYWFGEHKVAGPAGNRAQVGVHVYSSHDLYHWSDRGIALAVSDDPASEIARGCIIERPKVVRSTATGKYVMWFHLEFRGHGYATARAGVAVSDTPVGPYRYVGSFRSCAGVWPMNLPAEQRVELSEAELAVFTRRGRPSTRPTTTTTSSRPAPPPALWLRRDFRGGQMVRDMTLFVDDDGHVYAVYSSEENDTIQIAQLTDDCLHTDGKYVRVFPAGQNEAPVVFKAHQKYWLITSGTTGWAPNAARLAVADSIWGPWKKVGNPCVGTAREMATTFGGQGTFALPVDGGVIFMADRWNPRNPIDGRYVWLPVQFRDGVPSLAWQERWDLRELANGANRALAPAKGTSMTGP